jgi:hypothetical protein
MSADKSASAVVLLINTQFFWQILSILFKNGEFSPKNAISHKIFQV